MLFDSLMDFLAPNRELHSSNYTGTDEFEQRITSHITVFVANLGCFIQPSRCMCPPASLSCWPGELPLSRHRPSVRCSEQSLDMPHVAGRQGEHFGWHRAWHSEEEKHCWRERNATQKQMGQTERQQPRTSTVWSVLLRSALQLTQTGSSLATKVHSIQAHSTLGSSHVESHCEVVGGVVVDHPLSLPLSVSLTVLQTTAIL